MQTLIGRTLGRYRLESSLGMGGMAEVFRAVDDRLGRAVAVKVVLPAYAGSGEFRQRFLREARLVATLEHPNVVPIYDFGEDGGLPYLVMPLFEGGALSDRLAGAPLPPGQVARWLRDLAGALDAAHDAGVLHRDVKPSNVLIDRNGRAMLADFGIALAAGVATRLTSTGTVIGTPGYMAPELAAGASASPASDRYALGVLAYELLTGAPPFVGEGALAVLNQHATRPVPPISERLAGAPSGLDPLFAAMLAKPPEERPASAAEFAEALGRLLVGDGTGPTVSLPFSVPTRPPDLDTAAGTRPAPPPSSALTVLGLDVAAGRRRNLLRALSAAALLLAGAAGGAWLWQRLSSSPGGAEDEELAAAEQPTEQETSRGTDPAAQPASEHVPPVGGPGMKPGSALAPSRTTAASQGPEAAPAASAEAVQPPRLPPPDGANGRLPAFARRGQQPPGEGAAGNRPRLRARPLATGEGPRRRGEMPGREAPATEADFLRIQERAEAALARNAEDRTGRTMRSFAAGGLAYLAGDEAAAATALADVQELGGLPALLVAAGPLWVIKDRPAGPPFLPWELAVAFGDGRGTGLATVESRLASTPTDLRARFGRAYLSRLHGRHEQAIEDAAACHEQAARGTGSLASPAASLLAAFLAEEHAALGHWADALAWYRKACQAGNVMACRRAEALAGRQP